MQTTNRTNLLANGRQTNSIKSINNFLFVADELRWCFFDWECASTFDTFHIVFYVSGNSKTIVSTLHAPHSTAPSFSVFQLRLSSLAAIEHTKQNHLLSVCTDYTHLICRMPLSMHSKRAREKPFTVELICVATRRRRTRLRRRRSTEIISARQFINW